MIGPAVVTLLCAGSLIQGQVSNPSDEALRNLTMTLRPLLLKNIPDPLYEKSKNWDHTEPAANGIHWQGLKPRITKSQQNDGTWRKIRLTAIGLPDSLEFKLSDLKAIAPDTQGMKAKVSLPVHVDFEQQVWESGVRLYSGSTRARLVLHADLDCEYTLRLEKGQGFLPDTVFRFHVVKAKVTFDDVVVEHTAGVGGSAAKLLGQAMQDMLNQWYPSVERNLLTKADAAIVKAADTKEVRLSFEKLLKLTSN